MWGHHDPFETRLAELRKRSAATRRQAVEDLGQSLDSRAIRPLIRMLRDPDHQVQCAAVNALIHFGRDAVELLIHGIEDESVSFQEHALDVLKTVNDERAIPVCIELLGTSHHHLRIQAADMLKDFGPAAIPALWDALDHINHTVRSEALEILAVMPHTRAAACVLDALTHPSSYVREKAADLFLHQGECAIESLSELLDGQNALAASTILDILARIGGVQPLPVLEKALAYPQWQVREKTIEVLGHLHSRGAAELLAKSLADPEKYIRRQAVEMLGKQESSLAVAPLILALSDSVPEIQKHALRCLGAFGDIRAVEPMISFVCHSDDALRQEAAAALRKIRDVRALPQLLPLVHAEQAVIREQAESFLAPLFAIVEAVVFGSISIDLPDPRITVWNLETSDLTMVMPALSTVIIQPDTYDFYQVERFLTYAVNSLGQDHLKHRVAVHLYGHPYSLPPNLRNSLEHLFERIVIRGMEM